MPRFYDISNIIDIYKLQTFRHIAFNFTGGDVNHLNLNIFLSDADVEVVAYMEWNGERINTLKSVYKKIT